MDKDGHFEKGDKVIAVDNTRFGSKSDESMAETFGLTKRQVHRGPELEEELLVLGRMMHPTKPQDHGMVYALQTLDGSKEYMMKETRLGIACNYDNEEEEYDG